MMIRDAFKGTNSTSQTNGIMANIKVFEMIESMFPAQSFENGFAATLDPEIQ